MGMPPMNRPPMGGGAPPPAMGGDEPQPGMGGGDFAGSLQQLRASLPPEMQSKLDATNPITQLLFKRLRDHISEPQGQALLNLFGQKADASEIDAMRAFLPEIIVLLDIFDDGELNNSVGGEGDDDAGPSANLGGAGGAAPPGAPPPMNRPETAARPPRPQFEDDDEGEDDQGAIQRLSSIRA